MTAPKWYDFTLSKEKVKEKWKIENMERLGHLFENIGAERYVIGDEIGENGYEHYQVRVVFKKEMAEQTLHNIFKGIGRVSPTHVRNFDYCEKEGKFFRSWEKALKKYADIKLKNWQGEAIALLGDCNEREIAVIIDEDGNHGKSVLGKYMQVHRIAQYVPPMGDAQDLMAFAMAKPSTGYVFDLPRSESVKQKKGMWSAIEQIKNGYLYDKRYSYRDMWIEPPKILVLTNEEPPLDALSRDRWKLYTFDRYATDSLISWFGPD